MSDAVSPSTGRAYGVARVATLWGVARATVYRRRGDAPERPRRRPRPSGPVPDAELVTAIRQLLAANEFHAGAPTPPAAWGWGRGLPQDLGAPALRRHPHLEAPGAATDPRARSAGAASRRPAARPARPRRHHPHRTRRRHVGHRHDHHPHRRGQCRRLRPRRSRLPRHDHHASRGDTALERPPQLFVAVVDDHGSQFVSASTSSTSSTSSASKARPPSSASPRARGAPNASSAS